MGHPISPAGIRPNAETKSALMKIPMPKNLKQVRALMGGMGYYRKFLPDQSKRIRPPTALLRKGVFTPAMGTIVRQIFAELAARQFWSSRIGTLQPTAPAPSMCTVTPVSMGFVPRLNKNNRTARYGPLHISAALPSTSRGIGPRWTRKLAALSGPSNDSEAIYGGRSFAYFRTTKHLRAPAR